MRMKQILTQKLTEVLPGKQFVYLILWKIDFSSYIFNFSFAGHCLSGEFSHRDGDDVPDCGGEWRADASYLNFAQLIGCALTAE